MAIRPDTQAVRTQRAAFGDLLEVFGWLDRDPVGNVYLVSLVLRDGLSATRDEYWLARRGDTLAGLLCLGGSMGAVLPVGDDPAILAVIADRASERIALLPRRFQVVGPREAVDAIVERLRRAGIVPRLHRPQTYMAVPSGELRSVPPLPELRVAQPTDYDLVFQSGAELRAEELEEDPRIADPEGYARRVQAECREGYTYLWVEDGALRFRASLSALTADAMQISGVYTPPEWRNRGYARRGVAELCSRFFDRTRAACLFVNDVNAPALSVYRRLGFQPTRVWATAFYAGGRHPAV